MVEEEQQSRDNNINANKYEPFMGPPSEVGQNYRHQQYKKLQNPNLKILDNCNYVTSLKLTYPSSLAQWY